MFKGKINIGNDPYFLYIGKNLIENLSLLLNNSIENRSIFILTDENVFKSHGKVVIEELKNNVSKLSYYIVPSGEGSKTMENYEKIIINLVDKNFNRNSVIIALGGGVIGDLAGFVASTYMRGIDIIHIPTTLLAQIDSSIGGKTGINYKGFKNLLGTFYHPKAVVIDINTLETLPSREYKAAFGEIIKYGMLGSSDLLVDLNKNWAKYLSKSIDLDKIILSCIKMKEEIVIKDERDNGLRQTLNLGHTFAHGIESATGFKKFFHGEAVAMGLLLSTLLSFNIGLIKEDYYIFIESLIYKYFPNIYEVRLNSEEVLRTMTMDKKNKDNSITFILPVKTGEVKLFNNIPIEIVEKTILEVNDGFSCK